MNVTISKVSCAGLRNRDGWRGTSDPFVVFRPMNVRPSARFEARPGSVRLPPKRNTLAPSWNQQVVVDLGARRNSARTGPPELSIEVWDSDSRTVGSRYDDLLGYIVIPLEQSTAEGLTLDLVNGRGGTITLSYSVAGIQQPAASAQEEEDEPLSVRLFGISCSGLASTDGRNGTSDPYLKAHLHKTELTAAGGSLPGLRRLPSISNTLSPEWVGGELEFERVQVGETATVEVWDSDSRQPSSRNDDLLGYIRVPITKASGEVSMDLQGDVLLNGTNAVGPAIGQMNFKWSTVAWPTNDDELQAAKEQRKKEEAARVVEEAARAAEQAARQAREEALVEAAKRAREEEAARKAAEVAAARAEAAQKAVEEAEAARKAVEEAEAAQKAAEETEAAQKAVDEAEAARKAVEEAEAARKAAEEAEAARKAAEAEAAARKAAEEAARKAAEDAAARRAAEEAVRKAKEGKVIEGLVTRHELREMSRPEQERFVAALKTMMVNQSGPGTSEYARIAGYHGWGPGEHTDYCHHGQETFPGWHRAYLVEMEKALQTADRANGNDGKIGLPYWDWSDTRKSDVLPAIIREHFSDLPADLVPNEGLGQTLVRRGFTQVPSDRSLRRQFQGGNLIDQAELCLGQEEHWLLASTKYRRGVSVEQPHNSVHVMCGFPMTSVRYAAFYPIFYLHHCNIDRIYSKYVEIEGVSNCRNEFQQQQARLVSQGRSRTNLYTAPLTPFKHPTRGDDFMCDDTFDTEKIGYKYDSLPPEPPQRMTAMPTYAVFENIFPLEMNNKSFGLYVFAMPPEAAESWQPAATVDEWLDQPEFAGSGAIFGGKGKECKNCVERDPYNVLVDISDSLYKQGLSRFDAVIYVMCCDEEGVISKREDTPVPEPFLNGPFLEKPEQMTQHTDGALSGADGGDIRAIQLWLEKYGWYTNNEGDKNVDGWFGDATEAAVKAFQGWSGLTVDGIAGPETKRKIMQARMDVGGDEHGNEPAQSKFTAGQTLKYNVMQPPAYLDSGRVFGEVKMAFDEWTSATNLSFIQCDTTSECDILIEWSDTSPENLLPFGTHGGALAVAKENKGVQMVFLDETERWLLFDHVPKGRTDRGGTGFYMLPVITHEIGHVLGLSHSKFEDDLMSPYYKAGCCYELSNNDIARVVASYGEAKSVVATSTAPAPANQTSAPADNQTTPSDPVPPSSVGDSKPVGGDSKLAGGDSKPTAVEAQPTTSCCCSTM